MNQNGYQQGYGAQNPQSAMNGQPAAPGYSMPGYPVHTGYTTPQVPYTQKAEPCYYQEPQQSAQAFGYPPQGPQNPSLFGDL